MIKKLPDGTIEADTGEELAEYETARQGIVRLEGTEHNPGTKQILQHIVNHYLDRNKSELIKKTPSELASALCDFCDPFEYQYGDVLISCCKHWLQLQGAAPSTEVASGESALVTNAGNDR